MQIALTSQAHTAVNVQVDTSSHLVELVLAEMNVMRSQMCAVMEHVRIHPEAIFASVTMDLKQVATKPCVWILMSVIASLVAMVLARTPWALITASASPASN